MNAKPIFAFVLPFLLLCSGASAQKLTSDIPYVENGHERHVLDIYTPEEPAEQSLPVMFWPSPAIRRRWNSRTAAERIGRRTIDGCDDQPLLNAATRPMKLTSWCR